MHDLDLTVRAAGLNGIPLLGNGGSVDDPATPDRWAGGRGTHRWGGLAGASCRARWPARLKALRNGAHAIPRFARARRRENNVEQVALDSLPPGPVAISVRGHTIFGEGGLPQYALVVNGDFRWGEGWGGLGCFGARYLPCHASAATALNGCTWAARLRACAPALTPRPAPPHAAAASSSLASRAATGSAPSPSHVGPCCRAGLGSAGEPTHCTCSLGLFVPWASTAG